MILLFTILIGTAHAENVHEVVRNAAVKYGIEPELYHAIIAQESNYKVDAVNKKSKDYGLAQINARTAKAYNFSIERLLKDARYNAEAGAKVLHDLKKSYSKREPLTWVCRYNVGSGPMVHAKAKKCIKYINRIMKHYKGDVYVALKN